jgi:hypothetical protein
MYTVRRYVKCTLNLVLHIIEMDDLGPRQGFSPSTFESMERCGLAG